MDQFQHNSTSQKQFVTLLKDLSQEKKKSSFNILFMLIMYMKKITRFWLAENECLDFLWYFSCTLLTSNNMIFPAIWCNKHL